MADTNPANGSGKIDLRGTGNGNGSTVTSGGSSGQSGQQQDDSSIFSKFEIPETVREKYSDLIPLILQTESMNDDERQYWFQILPIMTEDQVKKLREILDNEKKQLHELDKEYENEVKRINEKHVSEWKAFEAKEKRKKLQETEAHTQKQEEATEEELLKKLQGL